MVSIDVGWSRVGRGVVATGHMRGEVVLMDTLYWVLDTYITGRVALRIYRTLKLERRLHIL